MKEKVDEFNARRVLALLANSGFIDTLPLDDRGKIILTLLWRDRETYSVIAKKFSITEDRVKDVYWTQVNKMSNFLKNIKEIEALRIENKELLNTLYAYEGRFKALDETEEEIIPEKVKKRKLKPTKEKFGDIKTLSIRVEELNLPDRIVWKLIAAKITNLGILSSFWEPALESRGLNKKDIELLQEILIKYNLTLKQHPAFTK